MGREDDYTIEPGAVPWMRDVRGEQVLPLINDDNETLRVAAGPGTGKTFGLRRRVLRLLHPEGLGVPSDRVLVCAFNRAIAADLRQEIEAELAPYGLELPIVLTVHGLAGRLAGEQARYLLPQEIEAMVYDLRVADPDLDAHYDHKQAEVMRALRQHEAGTVDHPALGTAARQWLTAHGAALVGDLPRRVEERLRGGDFDDDKFDHVIIDEFQDLTEVEARLVLGLRAEGGSVVALGDKKQSIYSFRGNEGPGLDALPELVNAAVADNPMNECQRCPSEIVLLANDVMATYNEPLQDTRGGGGQVHQIHSKTPEDEHELLAKELVKVWRERPDDKHLVLVTRRQWGYDLRNAIRVVDADVTAQTVFSEDILETWPAREAFIFLSIVADSNDAATFRDWISYQGPDKQGKNWKAPERNAAAYARLRADRGVLDLAKATEVAGLGERDLAGQGRRNVFHRCQRLATLLGEIPTTEDVDRVIAHVLNADRWIVDNSAEPELARDDIDRLRKEADRMLSESKDGLTLKALVQKLRYRISIREPLGQEEQPDIKIVTLWGAKGLTADFVYISGLCDEALPGPYDKDSTELTEEEHKLEQLRLLYVSLTRAKRALVISRPRQIQRGLVDALGLRRSSAGSQYRQQLQQCGFFSDVPASLLPTSVEGKNWVGIVT